MPVVTVPARPSGLPTAMTGSPTLSCVGVAEGDRLEVARRAGDGDDGQVGARVGARDGGLVGAAVVERHRHLRVAAGAGDDVVVGEDVALGVDDDAGALALALAGRRR